MSLASASVLLFTASAKNRVLRQLHRLRQPKYLVGAIASLAYFWWFFVQRWMTARNRPVDPASLERFELPIAAVALVVVASRWLFGVSRNLIAFTEAEVQFLFSAPVTRRQLLHFRAAKALLRTGLSALFASAIGAGVMPIPWPAYFATLWLAFGTLSLHTLGLTLTEIELERFGRWGKALRSAIGLAVFAAIAVSVLRVQSSAEVQASRGLIERALASGTAALETAPLSLLLLPIRWVVGIAFASSAAELFRLLAGGLALLGAHYLWVVTRGAAFEERATQESEQLGQRLRQGALGAAPRVRARGFAPRLSAHGPPELALAWRSLVSFARARGGRELLPLLIGSTVAAVAFGFSLEMTGMKGVATPAALSTISVLVVLFGPSTLRMDFRQDLERMDLLRTLPLPGWRIALGQLAAPALILTATVLLCAAGSLLSTIGLPAESSGDEVRALAISLAFVGPPLAFATLVVHNGIALLFPDWAHGNEPFQERSMEWMGQRMLTWLGSWLVVIAAILPAAAVGALVAALLWSTLGFYAAAVGAVFAGAVLAVECAAGLLLLGRAFARFDPAR